MRWTGGWCVAPPGPRRRFEAGRSESRSGWQRVSALQPLPSRSADEPALQRHLLCEVSSAPVRISRRNAVAGSVRGPTAEIDPAEPSTGPDERRDLPPRPLTLGLVAPFDVLLATGQRKLGGRTVRPLPMLEAWSTGAEGLERRGRRAVRPPTPSRLCVRLDAGYRCRRFPSLGGSLGRVVPPVQLGFPVSPASITSGSRRASPGPRPPFTNRTLHEDAHQTLLKNSMVPSFTVADRISKNVRPKTSLNLPVSST